MAGEHFRLAAMQDALVMLEREEGSGWKQAAAAIRVICLACSVLPSASGDGAAGWFSCPKV